MSTHASPAKIGLLGVSLAMVLGSAATAQSLRVDFQPELAPASDTQTGYVAVWEPLSGRVVEGDLFDLRVYDGAGANVLPETRTTGPIALTDLDDLLRDGLVSDSNLRIRFEGLEPSIQYRVRFYLHDEAGVADMNPVGFIATMGNTRIVETDLLHSGVDNPAETPSVIEVDFNSALSNTGVQIAAFSFTGSGQVHVNGFDLGRAPPPCPADINGDGVLDNGDIGAFVALFLAGDLAADFNGDGVLDNGDIGAFVTSFLAGC